MTVTKRAESWFKTASPESLGRFGEAFCKRIFEQSGIRYLSLCEIREGGAPLVRGECKTIAPDFDVANKSFTALIDCKVKSGPVYFRMKRQYRHGINLRNYQHYKQCGDIYRKDTGLIVIELWDDAESKKDWSGSILVESFRNLPEPEPGVNETPAKVYWRRKDFVDIESFTASELLDIAKGRLHRAFKTELGDIFNTLKQRSLFE